ncbi:MAG: Gfo/Idh/MocA family oxidoreductase [Verrucomicrobia bacterium]|nr:Gfo/Idh/MocA family oxidoreductase [Verrucomicrobiota bacterium]
MKSTRREFLKAGALTAGSLYLATRALAADAPARTWRAAIIGRTGGGDYGHGYDQIFKGLDGVVVEAIADRDEAGLQKAAARSGAQRQYRDYREMLAKEKPDLVAIAPRQPDCHKEMCLAAIEVCRGIFIEKPLAETPADADAILSAADQRGVKIQVAHNRRYTPDFVRVGALVREGLIGEVRQVQIYGKQDTRAGGEDMIVLGTHDFDLMRSYFGDPLWCQASVTVAGRDIERADVAKGKEPILVAGDTIHALFGFPKSVVAHWSSVKRNDHWNTNFAPKREKWAFEILGTKGVIAYQSGVEFLWLDSPFLAQKDAAAKWQPLPAPSGFDWPEHARHPIKSLIHAIETGAPPVCSGHDGRWAVEMVAAVYESQRTRSRVDFPLKDRGNPLLKF